MLESAHERCEVGRRPGGEAGQATWADGDLDLRLCRSRQLGVVTAAQFDEAEVTGSATSRPERLGTNPAELHERRSGQAAPVALADHGFPSSRHGGALIEVRSLRERSGAEKAPSREGCFLPEVRTW